MSDGILTPLLKLVLYKYNAEKNFTLNDQEAEDVQRHLCMSSKEVSHRAQEASLLSHLDILLLPGIPLTSTVISH